MDTSEADAETGRYLRLPQQPVGKREIEGFSIDVLAHVKSYAKKRTDLYFDARAVVDPDLSLTAAAGSRASWWNVVVKMHAAGAERADLRTVGQEVIQEIVAALVVCHTLFHRPRVIEFQMSAIIRVLNLVSVVASHVDSEAESESK